MNQMQRAGTGNFTSIEDTLQAIASPIQDAWDYVAITYVAAGNGVDMPETLTYKTGGAAGTTVATLTLAYDADDQLTSITQT